MKSKLKFIEIIRKHIGLSAVSTFLAVATICGVVRALEGSTSTNENSESSSKTQITSEEIDKIIQDLKISGNENNINEKLDEIITRAKLSGNTELQEYATNMKQSYELQKQLDSVNSLIEAMKKKNSNIKGVDEQVKKIISVDTIAADLDGAVSTEALLVLKSLDNESSKKLLETLAEVESLVDLNDISSLSVQQRSLLDIIILSKIIDENLVEGEKLELASSTLAVAATILESYQKQDYIPEDYTKLISGTERFLDTAKKASSVSPEQIVFLDGHFNMKHPPLMYDGHILMAIEDLYQYVDATIEYMYNNATMVIKSPNKILEIVSGKNVAYLNDIAYSMPVPIISFEDTIYMSVEFFAQANDISYKWLPNQDFIVIYNNLNQLSNKNVPNQLSKG